MWGEGGFKDGGERVLEEKNIVALFMSASGGEPKREATVGSGICCRGGN
jgi:hypothetical protein